jgi:hypothetical protein
MCKGAKGSYKNEGGEEVRVGRGGGGALPY